MKILSSTLVEGRKLIPLKEYKKPLLVLGETEKAIIKGHEQKIDLYKRKINLIENEINIPGNSYDKILVLRGRVEKLMSKIEVIKSTIRDIKKAVYKNQIKNMV